MRYCKSIKDQRFRSSIYRVQLQHAKMFKIFFFNVLNLGWESSLQYKLQCSFLFFRCFEKKKKKKENEGIVESHKRLKGYC